MADKPATTVAGDTTSAAAAAGPFGRLLAADAACSLRVHSVCRRFPRAVLAALEYSGDGLLWFPVPIAVLLSPLPSHSPALARLLALLLAGLLLDLLLVGLLKFLIRRPRPVYNKGMHLVVAVDHWSFPSGHSTRVFFVAYFFSLSSGLVREGAEQLGLLPGSGAAVDWLVKLLFLWSAATAASRVLLGRHFVLDVIAGSCLGVVEALFTFWALSDFKVDSFAHWKMPFM